MFHSSFGFLVQWLLKNDPHNGYYVLLLMIKTLLTEFEGGGVGYRQCSLHFHYYSHWDHELKWKTFGPFLTVQTQKTVSILSFGN